MSNGHAGTNCVIAAAPNGFLFQLTDPLHYVNPFSLENGIVEAKKGTWFCQNVQPLLAATAAATVFSIRVNGNVYNCYSHFFKTAISVGTRCY